MILSIDLFLIIFSLKPLISKPKQSFILQGVFCGVNTTSWIIVDNVFDSFVIDIYTMVTHKKDAIIIVKLLYRALEYNIQILTIEMTGRKP